MLFGRLIDKIKPCFKIGFLDLNVFAHSSVRVSTHLTGSNSKDSAMEQKPRPWFANADVLGGLAIVLIGVVLMISSVYVDVELFSLALCNAGVVLIPVGALLTLLAVR